MILSDKSEIKEALAERGLAMEKKACGYVIKETGKYPEQEEGRMLTCVPTLADVASLFVTDDDMNALAEEIAPEIQEATEDLC